MEGIIRYLMLGMGFIPVLVVYNMSLNNLKQFEYDGI